MACPACGTSINLIDYAPGDWDWCNACDAMLKVERTDGGSLTLIQKSPATRTPRPPKVIKTRDAKPKKGSGT